MTIEEILQEATKKLSKISLTPRLDAEVLLVFILNKNREYIFQNLTLKISQNIYDKFTQLIDYRANHEPIAYIIKKKEFYGIDLYIDNRVLIPRPETEILVEQALKILRSQKSSNQNIKVVDVGTGSGCIPIALAKNFKYASYFALDVSPAALQVARINIDKYKLKSKIKLFKSDLLQNYNYKVDVITANLPYLTVEQIADTEKNVRKYEPEIALLAGKDEIYLYDKLLYQATRSKINKSGKILLEIDPIFKKNILKIAKKHFPQAKFKIIKDYSKKDRVLIISI